MGTLRKSLLLAKGNTGTTRIGQINARRTNPYISKIIDLFG